MSSNLDQLIVTVVGGILVLLLGWLSKILWDKFRCSGTKFLFYKAKSFDLPDEMVTPMRGSRYTVLTIWNPTSLAIKKTDITTRIKLAHSSEPNLKILSVTDGRMSNEIKREQNSIFYDPDEIPPHSGFAIGLCPDDGHVSLVIRGEINNKPLLQWFDDFLPKHLHGYIVADGVLIGCLWIGAMLLPLGASYFAWPTILVVMLQITIFLLLWRGSISPFQRWALKRLSMPKSIKEAIGGGS